MEVKLGEKLKWGDWAFRDAVHIAVCPVEAKEYLFGAQPIGITDKGDQFPIVSGSAKNLVGFVDAMLKERIDGGDVFYMWRYPNQVTNMRHHWVHPDVPDCYRFDSTDLYSDTEKEDSSTPTKEQLISFGWLQNYAEPLYCSFVRLIDGADEYLREGFILGTQLEGVEVTDEFWKHYQIFKGVEVPEKKQVSYFHCKC